MRDAVISLRDLGDVTAVSPLYETEPIGGPDQGPFLNAVAVIETAFEPEVLLAKLLEVESAAGRVRAERWSPRTLDLDIITMVGSDGATVEVATDELTLPHPRAGVRRFVLEPLAEVWWQAPVGGATAGARLPTVADQHVELMANGWTSARPWQGRAFVGGQAILVGLFALALLLSGRPPEALRPQPVIGAVLALVGVVASLWGARSLGDFLTPHPEPVDGVEIVEKALYRYVRHPIYLGVTLFLLGVAILFGSLPAVMMAGATGLFFWIKAGYEETLLRLVDSSYVVYRRRVPGKLFPLPRRENGDTNVSGRPDLEDS